MPGAALTFLSLQIESLVLGKNQKRPFLDALMIGVERDVQTVAGGLEDGSDGWELSRMELQVLCWGR